MSTAKRSHKDHDKSSAVRGNRLDAFRGQAVLLLDPLGAIRSMTPEAAELLGRPATSLPGLPFGLIPEDGSRVNVDVLTPAGECKPMTARTLPEAASRESSIVVLEPRASERTPADVRVAAALDEAGLLRARDLCMLLSAQPQAQSPGWLRDTLSDVRRHLTANEPAKTGLLIVNSARPGSARVLISLETDGRSAPAAGAEAQRGFAHAAPSPPRRES